MSEIVGKPLDPRSRLWGSVEGRILEAAVRHWRRSSGTPTNVSDKLDQAARQFVQADINYDCFMVALSLSLQAVELLLRHILGPGFERATLGGKLSTACKSRGLLTEYEQEWLDEAAVHFRNELAHGQNVGMTPGMADNMVGSVFAWIATVSDRHLSHSSDDASDS